jgi:hypothetical protein
MTTKTYPKSIEGVPYRWIGTPQTVARVDGHTYKSGGRTAVLNCPVPGWHDVLVYEPDSEDWWDLLPSDARIRAAVRGPARNGEDLVGYALPLRNQPSELQAYIREQQGRQQVAAEPEAVIEQPELVFEEAAKPRLKRQSDRRPRGTHDDGLLCILEELAARKNVRVCDLVNELLWRAVDPTRV